MSCEEGGSLEVAEDLPVQAPSLRANGGATLEDGFTVCVLVVVGGSLQSLPLWLYALKRLNMSQNGYRSTLDHFSGRGVPSTNCAWKSRM